MLKTLNAIREEARQYREWFEFVSGTLTDIGRPQSASDLARVFCAGGQELDGRQATIEDQRAVSAALTSALQVFEHCKLITGALEERFTPNLRLYAPARVASLTSKGRHLRSLPHWRMELLFQRYLASYVVRKIWKPFAGSVAVATTVAGILKLVLLWQSEQAAIAGALAGIAALMGRLWGGGR